ncbi:hypothetical protein JOE31_001326 [Arthrobacter sp. PvP023]|nr:hypothetical protein [Arthrobacter sp. PvP023]
MFKQFVEFRKSLAKLRPLRTAPQRVRLNFEGRFNIYARKRQTCLFNRYYRWTLATEPVNGPKLYLRTKIHPYPGFGHQISVWLSGLLWSKDLGLQYLGGEVTRDTDGLLEIGDGSVPAGKLGQRIVYVSLPPTQDERTDDSKLILRGAVDRARLRHHKSDSIVFTSALDNPRYDQVPAESEIRRALLAGSGGHRLRERETGGHRRIAIHVRRGDISPTSEARGAGLSRWVSEEWYAGVIENLRTVSELRDLEISVISLGTAEDFPVLNRMAGVNLCLNGNSADDLIDLASADVLVTAPSSFSFTAALASRGIVLAPHPWWHEVPNEGRWFRLDPAGNFDRDRMQSIVTHRFSDRDSSA